MKKVLRIKKAFIVSGIKLYVLAVDNNIYCFKPKNVLSAYETAIRSDTRLVIWRSRSRLYPGKQMTLLHYMETRWLGRRTVLSRYATDLCQVEKIPEDLFIHLI